MHALFVSVLVSLPIATLAGQSLQGSQNYLRRQLARNAPRAASNNHTYKLLDLHEGDSFLDGWTFFTEDDPTHGNVNYVSQQDAQSKALTFLDGNATVIKVDNTSTVAKGGKRNSVRIGSKKSYNNGLFIADFGAMPTGCGIWPAWWSAGPNWPDAGEIDVIEGVNKQTTNQYTLHSAAGNGSCSISKDTNTNFKTFTSNILNTDCTSNQTSNTGCAFSDPDTKSFGQGFNNASGGVYAHLWDSTGIKIWHFAREDIPSDIQSRNPNPSSWPTPNAAWSSVSCDFSSHFFDHQLIIDTTICGDWAGATFNQDNQCQGTCSDIVADPTNFDQAFWKINYIAVYQ